ncbi:MAG: hypothetical protein M5U01_17915 [Ardenticatenaceae bacterium]|nr:hypothetical protein [Ardenticatenaceae bacterium]
MDEAVPLTEYAWVYRYPGPAAAPTLEEAEEARSAAWNLYRAILDRLPEVQP